MPADVYQSEAARTCARCGRLLHPDRELGQLCGAALDALERMRLVVPGGVKVALRMVSEEMLCRAGACGRGSP
jgi:hypothetical protein